MWNESYRPTAKECEQRAMSEGYVKERGVAFWETMEKFHWKSKFPLEACWASFMSKSKPHERLPTPPTDEQAAERNLIPPEVWYKQHLEEEARKERERIAREGEPIPMPEHMRRRH